ncbi:RidA family protein [Nocardioides sp. AE5]|uniref:RidA family protein n=1 Tax=Nocardioides sp. AE5 TaxID=2962573 RepID=UPI002881A4A9|nr:RidA family protein [Nocardioides sp. AE5]MDT0201842.1 RidA family protein [Nocardioides sp. AE5]
MINRTNRVRIMHRVVTHGDTVYVGGVTASDTSADMSGQTTEVCQTIEGLLEEAGSSKEDLLTATIYVVEMQQKDQMTDAWLKWLDQEHLPARAVIGVAELGHPRKLVEIVVTAALSTHS